MLVVFPFKIRVFSSEGSGVTSLHAYYPLNVAVISFTITTRLDRAKVKKWVSPIKW